MLDSLPPVQWISCRTEGKPTSAGQSETQTLSSSPVPDEDDDDTDDNDDNNEDTLVETDMLSESDRREATRSRSRLFSSSTRLSSGV